jgi:predicted ATPase
MLVATRYDLSLPDEDRLVAYLQRHAEGNPFFATELLRTLEEEGLLRPIDGGWTLGEIDQIVLPPLLRQVIDGRVARLGEETRRPLAIAAVICQDVPLDLWATVSGLAEEELLAVVEQAVDAHLLEATHEGRRVRFVHALTREALYEGVLPPRRLVWHRQVGETLAAAPGADPDEVAYHLQQAGDQQAWEWLVRAGERAQRGYAWLTRRGPGAGADTRLAPLPLRPSAALRADREGDRRPGGGGAPGAHRRRSRPGRRCAPLAWRPPLLRR